MVAHPVQHRPLCVGTAAAGQGRARLRVQPTATAAMLGASRAPHCPLDPFRR